MSLLAAPLKKPQSVALDSVATAIQRLLIPATSLYHLYRREQEQARREEAAQLESKLLDCYQRGFSAAAAIRALSQKAAAAEYTTLVSGDRK